MKPIEFPAWPDSKDLMKVHRGTNGAIGIEWAANIVWFHHRQAHLLIEAIEKAVKAAQRSEPNG